MSNKTNYVVGRKDIYTSKSQYEPVENMIGYKTLSSVRGCQPFPYPGTLNKHLKLDLSTYDYYKCINRWFHFLQGR
jgi:hypothetical protein